jgi:4-alpha-glucanotransferase
MSKDGHRWWKKRLEVAQTLYHIYRIDHAVGFFRIWGVGPGKDPMQGHFIPKDQESWEENGKRIFSMMLQFTNMLPIAEDLGIVPLNIRKAIKKMGICGTCVVRSMYHSTNKRFFTEGKDYHPLSMATLGTHDMLPMSIWYQSYPRLAKRFAKFIGVKYDRKWSKKHQFKALAFSHKTKSAFTINLLDEYLCLEEAFCIHPEEGRRINHPGTLLESNWTYRIPYTLEKITKHEKLNQKLCQLTK